MKKVILACAVIVVFAGYALYQHNNSAPAIVNTKTTTGQSTNTGTPVALKDGQYTGAATNAFYGTVQVKAIVSGGKLTDVQILQAPSDRGHSAELTQSSMPVLTSEAISAQSSNVQIVSGATQTSQAFQQSLQSALAQAM